jgi:hypothetical protein
MRYESLTVKGLDVSFRVEDARKRGSLTAKNPGFLTA